MENITLADSIVKGLNNPDCAFFVGGLMGELLILRIMLFLGVLYLIIRFADSLILTPFLMWIKNKIYGNKNKANQT